MLIFSFNSRGGNAAGLLEASWCFLEVSWGVFEVSWDALETSLERLGASLAVFSGRLGGVFSQSWGRLGGVLGDLGAQGGERLSMTWDLGGPGEGLGERYTPPQGTWDEGRSS